MGEVIAVLVLMFLIACVLALFVAVGWILHRLRRSRIEAARRHTGARAEGEVRRVLGALAWQRNCYVFSELTRERPDGSVRGDIDHLLVSAAGLFVVETKGHRGVVTADFSREAPLLLRDGRPFTAGSNPRPKDFLRQLGQELAELRRGVIRDYKREPGRGGRWVPVEGVVCFTRATIGGTSAAELPAEVCTLEELPGVIGALPPSLPDPEVDVLARIVSESYGASPDVSPPGAARHTTR